MATTKANQVIIGDSLIHNKGLFANQVFDIGDLIFTEHPLIISKYSSNQQSFDINHLSQIITSTPKHIIELITKLYCPSNNTSIFVEKAQSLINQSKCKLNLKNCNVSFVLLTKIITILLVNGLRIRIKNVIIGSGLFYTISHCNHSCLPNAEWCTIKDNNDKIKIVLKAVQKIEKNDEIFISYFSHTHTYRDIMYRQLYLKQGWNFKCKCKRCLNNVDDVRRFKLNNNDNQYYYAPNNINKTQQKMDDKQILAEEKFIQSKLWMDINNCDLSYYGDKYKQLKIIENVISKLKHSGLHSTHYLFLELLYPLASLISICRKNEKDVILSILLNKSVMMKELIKQPNIRLLENEMEIIELLLEDTNNTKYLQICMDHIKIAIKLCYILYPRDQHQSIEYLKKLLVKVEKNFIKKGIALQLESKICVICRKENVNNRCSRCQKAYYCNTIHQKYHWKVHKLSCKKTKSSDLN